MTRNQIFGGQKAMRTQITDLPQIAVELSEREMRIVSGGLNAIVAGCGVAGPPIVIGPAKNRTYFITGRGDHDTD